MKKKLQLIMLIICSTNIAFSQKTILYFSERKKNEFSKKIISNLIKKELRNEQNLPILITTYYDDTLQYEIQSIQYDKTSKILKETFSGTYIQSYIKERVYVYDSLGRFDALVECKNSDTITKKHFYNSSNQLERIEYKRRLKEGYFPMVEYFFYDGFGICIRKEEISNNDQSRKSVFEYTYSENDGSKTEKQYWQNDKRKKLVETRIYNSNGDLIKMNPARNDGSFGMYTYTYNEYGEWTTMENCNKTVKSNPWTCSIIKKVFQ